MLLHAKFAKFLMLIGKIEKSEKNVPTSGRSYNIGRCTPAVRGILICCPARVWTQTVGLVCMH
jgi:hypothetical protein